MSEPTSRTDAFFRRHPRLLVSANLAMLAVVLATLVMTTEAPVVLYQAF